MRQSPIAARMPSIGAMLVTAALVAISPPMTTAAAAKTIKMPEDAPQVVFDIPEDWTATPTPLGLNLAPPDKSALIVAGLVKREKSALTNWQRDATEAMKHFGVSFDPKATKPAKTAAAPAQTVFSGAPSIGTPEQGPTAPTTSTSTDKSYTGLPLEDLTGRAAPKGAKIPVNGLVIYGASYLGTPVDAEFLNFALSSKELFLMQQESGKSDDRIGLIVDSVRRVDK